MEAGKRIAMTSYMKNPAGQLFPSRIAADEKTALAAGGQLYGSVSTTEPIVLSSKNYMVGFGVGAVIGVAIGATAMHLSMRKKSKR